MLYIYSNSILSKNQLKLANCHKLKNMAICAYMSNEKVGNQLTAYYQ